MGTTKEKRGAPTRYDEEFKSGAVHMVTEGGDPVKRFHRNWEFVLIHCVVGLRRRA